METSNMYLSKAMYVENQDDFYNCVIKIKKNDNMLNELTPISLFNIIKNIEVPNVFKKIYNKTIKVIL